MLNRDFREFIQSLSDNGVRYLVVGGYAVAVHGHPRYTRDLDVWIDMSPDNAARIVAALNQFGFASLQLQTSDFLVPDQTIQLGHPPNRIDLMTTLPGVEFPTCYAARLMIDVDGLAVNFIDIESLRKNKRASGRHQDLADLENLE